MNLQFVVMTLRLVAGLALSLVIGATPALGQTVSGYPCGKVTAYTAPTTTTAGSVAIGTSTFQLAAGSVPDGGGIAVGLDRCLQGQRNAAGAFISAVTFIPMGVGACGTASAYTPSSTTTAGSITLTGSEGSVTLPVGPDVTLSPAQASGNHCYSLSVNAQGNAQVRAYSGPWEGGPVAPRQLPATSTAALSQGSATLVLASLAAAGALMALRLRRR